MNRVYLEETLFPCMETEGIKWHLYNGWVYDARDRYTGEYYGVVYCTVLAEFGVIVHFDTLKVLPWHVLLSGCRKVIRMFGEKILMAAIPARKEKVVRLARRLGFRDLFEFESNGEKYLMLRYAIVNDSSAGDGVTSLSLSKAGIYGEKQ